MALKKFSKITNKQITENGVQKLADRPNLTAQYGASGLSSTQLKAWFDKLSFLLAEHINEIVETLSIDAAAYYIRVCLDKYSINSLGDLIESFTNGAFALNILQVFPSASYTQKQTLQSVINNVAFKLANLEEKKLDKESIDGLVDKETFQQEIEMLAGELKELFQKATANEEEITVIKPIVAQNTASIARNTNAIALLADVQYQSGLQVIQPISEAYTARETANGLKILDWENNGSPAKLLKVEGSTKATKNLVNPALFKSDYTNAVFGGDGVITIEKVAGSSFTIYTDVLKAGNYVLSVQSVSDNIAKLFAYKGNETQPFKTITTFPYSEKITLEEATQIKIYGTVSSDIGTQGTVTGLQVEAGETQTAYAPYFNGLKSAMFGGVKSTGLKLFDDRGLINKPLSKIAGIVPYQKPFSISAGNYSVIVKLRNNDTVIPQTISFHLLDMWGGVVKSMLLGETASGNAFNCAYHFTLNESEASRVSRISFYVANDKISSISNDQIEYVMLNRGDTISENEPYVESMLMFPQPVELKEYDYLLFDEQKKVVKTEQHTFTGEESFVEEGTQQANWDSSISVSFVRYAVPHQQYSNYSGKGVGNLPFLGNPQTPYVDLVANATENCFKVQNQSIYIIYIGTLDELKAWLRDRYVSGDPVVIAYETETTTETPFTEAQKSVGDTTTSYNKGLETVINDNANFGVEPTLTQEYVTVMDIEETIQESVAESVDSSITQALQGEY